MISQMVDLPLPLDYKEACNGCWNYHHWHGRGNLIFVLQQDEEEWLKCVKGYEVYIKAISISGLTSVISRWEGSGLRSSAIIIFVVAMV